MIPVLIVYTFNVIGTILSCLHQKMKKSVMKCPPIQFYLYCWCHLKVSWNHQVFSSLREQNTPKKEGKIQITAFLLIASLSFFLLLIVSCLLGSQTCWWPLKSVFVCVCACACLCVHVSVCVCVCVYFITSVSSLSMCSLCVLSCYHISSCSPHRFPVIGLKSGLLFHQVSK